jgi:hypothetical protein
MTTMTVSEAHYVVFDIVAAEVANGRRGHFHHPVSALKGYDIVGICAAFNLLVANEFLLYADREVFEEKVGEEKFAAGVRLYETGPLNVVGSKFVADDQVDVLVAKHAFKFDDQRFLSQETASSFAEYCRRLGADDPLYWQKVYSRLELEYTSDSPRGNDVQPTTFDLDDPGVRNHFQRIVSTSRDAIVAARPHIGDCSLLPYQKKTILYATRWLMDHYDRRNQSTLGLARFLTRVARDWHQIELVDKEAIARLNQCESFPDWALRLKAKYTNEDVARNEALDVAFEVIKDRIACEKRLGVHHE